MDCPEEKKKAINEITACLMKYPEQMKTKLEELKTAVNDIIDELDKGYDEVSAVVGAVDKQGF